jgi:hypothetical protein
MLCILWAVGAGGCSKKLVSDDPKTRGGASTNAGGNAGASGNAGGAAGAIVLDLE